MTGRRRGARRVGGGVAAVALALLLAGCAGSPQAELDQAVSDVTDQANARNADGLRDAADTLIALLSAQSGSGFDAAKVKRLQALAQQVEDDAALLERLAGPAPTATASRTSSPPSTRSSSPSPTPSPSPSPTPSPSASPTPSASPSPTGGPTTAATTSPTPSRSPSPTGDDKDKDDKDKEKEDKDKEDEEDDDKGKG